MTNKEIQFPLFAKFTLIIIGLFAFFTILYITRPIVVPLVFATIIAIVKLVFDNIESLKLWGFLLGDTMPTLIKIAPILQKLKLK